MQFLGSIVNFIYPTLFTTVDFVPLLPSATMLNHFLRSCHFSLRSRKLVAVVVKILVISVQDLNEVFFCRTALYTYATMRLGPYA